MNHLIVGYGEIGKAVAEIVGERSIDIIDEGYTAPGPNRKLDVMHVCFPYSDKFVEEVNSYIETYKPTHTVIYSTVAIGTTVQIPDAVHSPVEGKHPNLAKSMKVMPRWVGSNNKEEGAWFAGFFGGKGLTVRTVGNSDFTEFLKLRSTSKYGINLMWADYEESVAADLGMPFEHIIEFDRDYNKLYKDMGLVNFQRYILTPPNGKIGGHCVVPNAKILNEQYPDEMLDRLEKMG